MLRKQVSPPWFGHIKAGRKVIEGRLNRSDFAKLQPGDMIEFFGLDSDGQATEVVVQVVAVRRYDSFEEMIRAEGLAAVLPGIKTISDGVAVYRKFFTADDEKNYGVLAVEIVLQRD